MTNATHEAITIDTYYEATDRKNHMVIMCKCGKVVRNSDPLELIELYTSHIVNVITSYGYR